MPEMSTSAAQGAESSSRKGWLRLSPRASLIMSSPHTPADSIAWKVNQWTCDTSISGPPVEQGVHAGRIIMDPTLSSRAHGRTNRSDHGRMIAVWH